MQESRTRHAAEIDPDVDSRIQEVADELLRISRRLSVRIAGDAPFLESVAQILKREHRLVQSLKSAVGHYDQLLDSLVASLDKVVKPEPRVIDVAFQPQTTEPLSVES